eukprot:TRINITY_DN51355_c0_g1_i1.p1 TRINITY_DN51355_c0_g1~~TRINITY_DN51355_c0_g1_i1.p1  ORF type:complete len:316 (+),score=58.17 TRINITY_DN51355_c0_g1_i1:100-1047(+)
MCIRDSNSCVDGKDADAEPIIVHDPQGVFNTPAPPTRIISHGEEAVMERALSSAMPPIHTMVKTGMNMKKMLGRARSRLERSHVQAPETGESDSREAPKQVEKGAVPELRASREEQIREGIKLLEQRLLNHNLESEEMADDGNCQFRALSHQLYGTQDYHSQVRAFVVEHIRAHAEEYQLYCDESIEVFLDRMQRDRVWGDEITLKAAVDALNATVHTVTSNEENWHLVYTPDEIVARNTDPVSPSSDTRRNKLFISYIAPVHYNSILPKREGSTLPKPKEQSLPIGKPEKLAGGSNSSESVSYTHLTLPTKRIV